MFGTGWQELTPRESAVLAAVERRLGNAEIAAEFHLSVRTVESHIAALRRKLNANSRSQLISVSKRRRGAAVRVPQNSFVGRAGDLAELAALLGRERWVTIVGAPGCGKTRLALEFAAADARVPVVVDLENAGAGDVIAVIARVLGLGRNAPDLVAACAVAFGAQRYLLVLDNCDRVADAAAAVVGRLLPQAGSLTVLATSRSPIGGSDEATYVLRPLPTDGQERAGAVRLFLDRAHSAAPTARFSDTDIRLVEQMCRRLDGLPLAIELAAARVRHLSVSELAAQLDAGFDTLDRAGRPSRHSTLEAAFDWTWDLLDAEERWVIARLAALPCTFELTLADEVAPGARRAVFRLLDRSLLTQDAAPAQHPGSSAPRFGLLGSLRWFVLDRTSPELVREVRRIHASHCAVLASRLAGRARTDDSRGAVETARRSYSQINAAIEWALAERHELALTLARNLAVLVEQYGSRLDSLDLLVRAARDPLIRDRATPAELLDLGIALCFGDLAPVSELASLALAIAADDSDRLAAHLLAGVADAYRDCGVSALEHLEIAERIAEESAEVWQLASVRQARGIALRGRALNDPKAAIAEFEAAMHHFARVGDTLHLNNVRYMMASTAADSDHDRQRAIGWVEQCAAYARDRGNQHELAHAMLTRAALSTTPHFDVEVDEAVSVFRAVGDLRCLTRSYLLLAAHRTASERVPLLQDAFAIASRAHDVAHQVTILELLIRALWASDAHREAAIALGSLVGLVGYDDAVARAPEAMVPELDRWTTVVVEGQVSSLR